MTDNTKPLFVAAECEVKERHPKFDSLPLWAKEALVLAVYRQKELEERLRGLGASEPTAVHWETDGQKVYLPDDARLHFQIGANWKDAVAVHLERLALKTGLRIHGTVRGIGVIPKSANEVDIVLEDRNG
jgi:hypothetical protein